MPISIFNHPLIFAAAAVFAVGVAVYELLNRQEERRQQYGRRSPPPPPSLPPSDRRPPPPDRRPPPPDQRPPPPDQRPPPPDQRPPSTDRKLSPPPDRMHPLRSDGSSPPSDQSLPSKNDSVKPLPKSSETSDNSTMIIKKHPNSPCNNLRKRNINKILTNDSSSDDSKTSSESIVSVEGSSKTTSIANNQNIYHKNFDEINYKKNLLGKISNDSKNVNENLKQNIYEEDSDSSDNNLFPKCEKKLINHTISNENACAASKKPFKKKRKSKKAVGKCSENSIDNGKSCSDNSDEAERKSRSNSFFKDSDCPPTNVAKEHSMKRKKCNSHASKNVSDEISKFKHPPLLNLESKLPETSSSSEHSDSTLCSDDDLYKMEILNALKNDICDSKENNPDSICSPEEIEKEEESNVCKACEENPINTHFHPCNHSYLCVECAVKFRRISKICAICLQNIDGFTFKNQ